MRPLRQLAVLCWLISIGCSSARATSHATEPRRPAKRARADIPATLYLEGEPAQEPQPDFHDLRFVGMDDGPVPEFRLRSVDGRPVDSKQLVGERAFVFVFFATWCAVCDLKMPMLRKAVDAAGPVTVIAVSVDDRETWPQVQPYLSRHHMPDVPVVRARSFPTFSVSYNPFSTVPLVVVVGQNGGLVDYQVGYAPDDEPRLEEAVRLAKRIGPLKAVP